MSNHLLNASLIAAALVSSVSAQTQYIPDSNATTGGCNVIPFGVSTTSTTWSNQHYQTMATFADLGSPAGPITICNLGFASCGTAANISHSDTIVIQFSQTNATALTTSFPGNLAANTKVVLSAKDFNWHQKGGIWERIGLDNNYLFIPSLGRNLVIDICVTGNRKPLGGTTGFHTGARQRLFNFGWTGNNCPTTGTLQTAALKWCVDVNSWSFTRQGLGCQNLKLELGGSAELGKSLSIAQTGPVRLGSKCFLVLGLQKFNPGFNLSVIGARDCFIYCNPLVTLPYSGRFTATVPNSTALICQHLCTQIYCLQQGYPGGIATTNAGIITPGIKR